MNVTLEYHAPEANSHKFYRVRVDGCTVVKEWGRIGTTGQTATSTAASAEAAEAEARKLLAAKESKGYEPAGSAATKLDASPAVRRVVPMLAQAGTIADLNRAGYLWSPKLDGVRCVAHFDGTTVKLVNRRDVDITARYPDVCAALVAQLEVPCVIDGELVAFDAAGKPSFALIAQRDQASKAATIAAGVKRVRVSFMAFDLLRLGERDMRTEPLTARLSNLALAVTADRPCVQVVPHVEDGHALWGFTSAQQLEGVVGKRATSHYVGRRGEDWIKIKLLHRVSCLVDSYELGSGGRAHTIGALQLKMQTPDGLLVEVGRVGTGFTVPVLAQLKKLLDEGQPFIAEVECLSLGTGRQLRQPAFKGMRSDLQLSDCSTEQLALLPTT